VRSSFLPGDGNATNFSEFVWENVFQPNLELVDHCFQFVQRQMVFTVLDSEERLMGQADLFCKLGVRQRPTLFPQKCCQLAIKIAMHTIRLANES